MKILFFLSVLTMVLINRGFAGIQIGLAESQKLVSTNEWGAVAYNTQLSLALAGSDKEIKTNQPVQLVVRIKNLSTNEDFGIYVQSAFTTTEGLSFMVTSPSGKEISLVFHGTFRVSGGIVQVRPGQIDGFSFPLDEICKADELGTYKIILKMKRWTSDRHKSFEIISNPLNIVVVQ